MLAIKRHFETKYERVDDPELFKGEVLEYALLCNDRQTCLAATQWPNMPMSTLASHQACVILSTAV